MVYFGFSTDCTLCRLIAAGDCLTPRKPDRLVHAKRRKFIGIDFDISDFTSLSFLKRNRMEMDRSVVLEDVKKKKSKKKERK